MKCVSNTYHIHDQNPNKLKYGSSYRCQNGSPSTDSSAGGKGGQGDV